MEVITTHQHADFDGMASMIAAKKLYPEAVLVFSGSQERSVRDFFLQSTAFLYEFQRLKNIPLEQVQRLILVDTQTPGRIGKLARCLENPGIEVHIYDHHPKAAGDLTGQKEVIRRVGSTITILTAILRERNIPISAQEATVFGLAIYEDTGSFTFDTTTPEDLAAMSWLLEHGANLQTIGQFIAQELSTAQVSLLHELIRAARTYTIQGIDIVVTTISTPRYVDDFSILVRRFMTMENLDCLFALARMADKLYLIGRSRIPEVNVGAIAAEFGGGGHASAASAAVKDATLIEAEERLLQMLYKHVRPRPVAREIMSAPVIYVGPDITIETANQTLTRYNLTVLPVLEDGKRLLGIISRRVCEKAIYHGLGGQPVADYMTTDFATLPPTATLADIQELIIEHRQRFIPVVEDGAVKGVITRTDLLNLLVNDPANLPRDLLDRTDLAPAVERHRQLAGLMADTLDRDTVVLLRTAGETAKRLGMRAFVVGGFVRDLLLHTPNNDIDIVVEGDGVAFAHELARVLDGKARPHEKFATAVVVLPDGRKIDVATARLEYYESPAAMPTVELSSLKLDLYRRDFTVNAMAIHLNPERFGQLVDYFNCQNDIRDRQIRILHNLSFVEDPTRILRAVRLEQRMGFTIGKHTEKLIKNAVKMRIYGKFAGRRFFNELRHILEQDNPLPALARLDEFGLLSFFIPDLTLDDRRSRLLAECQRALAWHKLLYLEERCRAWLVYLLGLFSGITGKKVLIFLKTFEVPERYWPVLLQERGGAAKTARLLDSRETLTNSEIYWLLDSLSHETLLYLMALCAKQRGKKAVSLYVTHLRHVRPALDGRDLIALGYRPGPQFKTMLNHLLEARLNGEVQSRADEEAFLRRHYPCAATPHHASQPPAKRAKDTKRS